MNLSLVLSCPLLSLRRVLLSRRPLLLSRRLLLPSRPLFLLSRRPLLVSRVVRVLSRVDCALSRVVPDLSLANPVPSLVLLVVVLRLPVANRVPRRLKAPRVGVTALLKARRSLAPPPTVLSCRDRSLPRPVLNRRSSESTDGMLGMATFISVSSRPIARYADELILTPGLSRDSRLLVRRTSRSTRLSRVIFRLTRVTFRLIPSWPVASLVCVVLSRRSVSASRVPLDLSRVCVLVTRR